MIGPIRKKKRALCFSSNTAILMDAWELNDCPLGAAGLSPRTARTATLAEPGFLHYSRSIRPPGGIGGTACIVAPKGKMRTYESKKHKSHGGLIATNLCCPGPIASAMRCRRKAPPQRVSQAKAQAPPDHSPAQAKVR